MTVETVEVIAPGKLPEGYVFDATVDGITVRLLRRVSSYLANVRNELVFSHSRSSSGQFPVTVPVGGVEEGHLIRVAYESSIVQPDGTRITETKRLDGTGMIERQTLRIDEGGEYYPLAPTGRFRNGMCDCCEVVFSGRFWVSHKTFFCLATEL